MAHSGDVSYTSREVLSYLPTGWRLDEGTADGAGAGAWRQGEGRWVARLVDGAEQSWDLAVAVREAERHGRLEALRRAVDRLYREALG